MFCFFLAHPRSRSRLRREDLRNLGLRKSRRTTLEERSPDNPSPRQSGGAFLPALLETRSSPSTPWRFQKRRGTRGERARPAVHHGPAVRPGPRRALGPAVPGKLPGGVLRAAPSGRLSAGLSGSLWRQVGGPGARAARGAGPGAGRGRAGSPRPEPHALASPAGLELRGVRAEAAGVRQQEGAAGEPQLLPRGRGAAAVRLQDFLPRVPQALPGQRVPRASLQDRKSVV